MNALTTFFSSIAKYLIVVPAAIFGLFHFLGAANMAEMVPIPGGIIWVYLTGVALIAAAVAVIINKKARMASTLLGVMILIFVLVIHLPAVLKGDDAAQMAMMGMLKDIMIAGGVFYFAGHQVDNNF